VASVSVRRKKKGGGARREARAKPNLGLFGAIGVVCQEAVGIQNPVALEPVLAAMAALLQRAWTTGVRGARVKGTGPAYTEAHKGTGGEMDERERERASFDPTQAQAQRQAQIQGQRDRETERQRDRGTERHGDRGTEGQRDNHAHTDTKGHHAHLGAARWAQARGRC
jgi:hypothetical protein